MKLQKRYNNYEVSVWGLHKNCYLIGRINLWWDWNKILVRGEPYRGGRFFLVGGRNKQMFIYLFIYLFNNIYTGSKYQLQKLFSLQSPD